MIGINKVVGACCFILSFMVALAILESHTSLSVGANVPADRIVASDSKADSTGADWMDTTIPILMYHHLSTDPKAWNSVIVSPEKFEADLVALKEAGYQTISFQDYLAASEGRMAMPINPIIITFDDGYQSNYEYAFPILQKHQMKATIHLIGHNVGFIPDPNIQWDPPVYAKLSWQEAREMVAGGLIDIHHHTYDLHRAVPAPGRGYGILPFANEPEADYLNRLRFDFKTMSELIEQELGYRTNVFAYPYGRFNSMAEELLDELGFRFTLTVADGISDFAVSTKLLRRINVPQQLPTTDLIDRLKYLDNFTVQGIPPRAPKNLEFTAIGSTTMTATWQPAEDDIRVAGYDVYLDGEYTGTAEGNEYTLTELNDYSVYNVAVKAFDEQGNRSIPSATIRVRTLDGTAPSRPERLKLTSATDSSVTIAWDPSTDEVGVTAYDVYLGEQRVDTVSDLSYTLNRLKQHTEYRIAVRARDDAGNVSEASSEVRAMTLDSTPPDAVTELTAESVTATGMILKWKEAADNVAVTRYEIYQDGQFIDSAESPVRTLGGLKSYTEYRYTVIACDAAGNRSAPSAVFVIRTLDGTPPSIPIGLKASGISHSEFTVSLLPATDNVGVSEYEWFLDGKSIASTSEPNFTYRLAIERTFYQIAVRAKDALGNVSAISEPLDVTTLAEPLPPIVMRLTASHITETGLRVNGSLPSLHPKLARLELYQGSRLVATLRPSGFVYPISGLRSGSVTTFRLMGRDRFGVAFPSVAEVTVQTKHSIVVLGPSIFVNGEPLKMESGTGPIRLENHLIVPFRPIFQALGMRVQFQPATKIIEARRPGYLLTLRLNSQIATVNQSVNKAMPVAPLSVRGVTLVPLRFIAEELGATVTFKSR